MALSRNLGMLLLSIWLIVTGLIHLFGLNFSGLGTIMAILAIAVFEAQCVEKKEVRNLSEKGQVNKSLENINRLNRRTPLKGQPLIRPIGSGKLPLYADQQYKRSSAA